MVLNVVCLLVLMLFTQESKYRLSVSVDVIYAMVLKVVCVVAVHAIVLNVVYLLMLMLSTN